MYWILVKMSSGNLLEIIPADLLDTLFICVFWNLFPVFGKVDVTLHFFGKLHKSDVVTSSKTCSIVYSSVTAGLLVYC